MRVVRIVVAVVVLAWPALARGEAIGIFSFDTLIPGPDGVTAFTITNLTGNNFLPPDFRVGDALTFLDVHLSIVDGGGTSTLGLGNAGPGVVDSQFPDSAAFASATVTFTLSSLQFLLDDGTTFQALSNLVSATLLPSGGADLAPGDFVVIDVAGATLSNVPEPGTFLMCSSGIVALSRARARARRKVGS